jgi:hypothetical protein
MTLPSHGLVSTARWGGALPIRSQAGDNPRSVEVSHAVRRPMIKLCHDRASVHRDELVLGGRADSVFRARPFELAPIMAWWVS